MIVKFFDTGKGSARSAFNYLLNDERVKAGTAKLISGNPEAISFLTEYQMKSTTYRGGALYTSGVLSFASDEQLADKDIPRIIHRFKEAMFPYLDHTRFNMAFIQHIDKDRTELHFVIQNYDLETKKVFTPFVKQRDLSRINAFKDNINAVLGLADPNQRNTAYHVKKLKRLSDTQKQFFNDLNKAFKTHLNEPHTSDIDTPEYKLGFLKKFIRERFREVYVNRSSSKSYVSLDFGEGQKMRLFYDVPAVKALENSHHVKAKQYIKKGIELQRTTPKVTAELELAKNAIEPLFTQVYTEFEALAAKKRKEEEEAKQRAEQARLIAEQEAKQRAEQARLQAIREERAEKQRNDPRFSEAVYLVNYRKTYGNFSLWNVAGINQVLQEHKYLSESIAKVYSDYSFKELKEWFDIDYFKGFKAKIVEKFGEEGVKLLADEGLFNFDDLVEDLEKAYIEKQEKYGKVKSHTATQTAKPILTSTFKPW